MKRMNPQVASGAVNTIRVRDKRLVGSNTDGEGFLRAIRSEFSVDLRDLRVIIIGAGGGTGRAIAWQCALENCERLVLVNRTLGKSECDWRNACVRFLWKLACLVPQRALKP